MYFSWWFHKWWTSHWLFSGQISKEETQIDVFDSYMFMKWAAQRDPQESVLLWFGCTLHLFSILLAACSVHMIISILCLMSYTSSNDAQMSSWEMSAVVCLLFVWSVCLTHLFVFIQMWCDWGSWVQLIFPIGKKKKWPGVTERPRSLNVIVVNLERKHVKIKTPN